MQCPANPNTVIITIYGTAGLGEGGQTHLLACLFVCISGFTVKTVKAPDTISVIHMLATVFNADTRKTP